MSSSKGPSINVTPLIDVLLVLLVIFLVVIPAMVKVEPVLLPPGEADGPPSNPIEIKLHADATATIDGGAPILAADLLSQLRPRTRAGTLVFVDFEDGVPWSDVVGTVDGVRGLVPDRVQVAVRIRAE